MPRNAILKSVLMLSLGLLTACGTAAPTPGAPRSGSRTIVSVPTDPALGDLARNQLGGTAHDDGRGGELLQRARLLREQLRGFEAELVVRTFGQFRGGRDIGQPRETRVRYTLAWAFPEHFKAMVLESSEDDMAGARMTTVDGETFVVRAPGLLGLVPRRLRGDDPRLTNARGHRFGDLRPDAAFDRLAGPTAVWTVVGGGQTPDGRPTVRVTTANVMRLDPGIDREELEMVVEDLAIYRLVAYQGMRRVLDYEFLSFRWTELPPEAFKI